MEGPTSGRDYSKYRVTVNGQMFDHLPKRRAALQVVKSIVESGVSPEALQEDVKWKYLFCKAPGRLYSE